MHPDLNLEIVSQTPGFSLSRREADVAVMVGKPTEPRLYFESLGIYRLGSPVVIMWNDTACQSALTSFPGID